MSYSFKFVLARRLLDVTAMVFVGFFVHGLGLGLGWAVLAALAVPVYGLAAFWEGAVAGGETQRKALQKAVEETLVVIDGRPDLEDLLNVTAIATAGHLDDKNSQRLQRTLNRVVSRLESRSRVLH
jgi:hypothetical protein